MLTISCCLYGFVNYTALPKCTVCIVRSCHCVCKLTRGHQRSDLSTPSTFQSDCRIQLLLFAISDMLWYPLGIPVVRGDVHNGYRRLFLHLFFRHFSLTTFSINRPKLLLYFSVVLHSLPTLSRSLLTQSSHRILGLLYVISPQLCGILEAISLMLLRALKPDFALKLILILNSDIEYLNIVNTMTRQWAIITGVSSIIWQ